MPQKYRSKFELDFANDLKKRKVRFDYERIRINYSLSCNYIPDFVLHNGTIIETKGRFTVFDRRKHLLIKSQHSYLDIRFVFYRSSERIRKGSKTTYADWCDKNGFLWAEKTIPNEWLKND